LILIPLAFIIIHLIVKTNNDPALQKIHQAGIPFPNVSQPSGRPTIKFKTNFNNCILEAFENRGHTRVDNDQWDIIWS